MRDLARVRRLNGGGVQRVGSNSKGSNSGCKEKADRVQSCDLYCLYAMLATFTRAILMKYGSFVTGVIA